MYVADDEDPRIRGARRWNALPLLLIAIGGAYGALIVAAHLSPQFAASFPWHVLGMNGPDLPFMAQLATAFAGLAGLVMVLSRAVREVDKHPYASIAPVLAVFSGLLHTGLRVDLSAWGLSSTQLTVLVLALALLGGVLIGHQYLSARLFGWALVIAPSALVVAVIAGVGPGAVPAPSQPPQSSERLFLVLLVGSALLLGVAGAVARRLLRQAQDRSSGGIDAYGWTGSELGAEAPVVYPGRHHTVQWRRGFSRSAQATAVVLAVAAGAYVAVDRLKHGATAGETSNAFASSPVGAPVVEQLDAASVAKSKAASVPVPQKRQRGGKQVAAHAASQLAAVVSERPAAAREPAKPAPPSKRASTPLPPPRASRGAPSRAAAASSGLPAWGAEATREFSGAKASKAASKPEPIAAKPAPASKPEPIAAKPAPVAAKPAPEPATPPPASQPSASSGRNAIPPPFGRPVAPPPAAAPPAKEENLTMDQLLNRVVGAARENRVRESPGAKAPKNEKDSELDDLLDQAMKNPPKPKK